MRYSRPSCKPGCPFIKTMNLAACKSASITLIGIVRRPGCSDGARPGLLQATSVILISRFQDVMLLVGWQDVTGLPSRDALLQPWPR